MNKNWNTFKYIINILVINIFSMHCKWFYIYLQLVNLDPLGVRYFEAGPKDLYRAADYEQEILLEDIDRVVNEPDKINKGSRVYYKFKF